MKSSLASRSPGNVFHDGVVLVALRKYYDGSKSVTAKPHMTLTCVAADESVWENLEPAWEEIRKARGNPAYIHMTDLMALPVPRGIYKGWSIRQRDHLIDGLLGVLFSFSDNPRIHTCTATVDLMAHARVNRRRSLPAPERICARLVFPEITEWYGRFPDLILDVIDAFFDQGEPFMRHVLDDWTSKKFKKRFPFWNMVRTVAPVVMEHTPPVQMADVICWGWQRFVSSVDFDSDPMREYALRAAHCLKGIYRPVDEFGLTNTNWKEEGSAVERLWHATEEAFMPNDPSPEFKKFDATMKRLMQVQHDKIKEALAAEKREKAKRKPKTSASVRESRERD